ncbi:MAG: hypothetical protein ACREP9_14095, partial [Candidatus Dormibacteraceae bacterium]
MGTITKLTVTLNGFTHTFQSDVGALLVGPSGQKVVLMNNDGFAVVGVPASYLTLTFDQAAANPIAPN